MLFDKKLNQIGSIMLIVTISSFKLKLVKANEQASSLEENNNIRPNIDRLIIITVVPDPLDDRFKRFNRSIETFALDLTVLRPNKEAEVNNNNTNNDITVLKKALATYRSDPNLLVMIVDSYNTIINGDQKDILKRFSRFDSKTRIVFTSNFFKESVESPLPSIDDKYLNSGAYIGYATSLWDLLDGGLATGSDEQNQQQAYYVGLYSRPDIRDKLAIRLDHRAELFQSLQANGSSVQLEFELDYVRVRNPVYSTEPIVINGQGESGVVLNSLGNYLAKAWTFKDGCRYCNETKITLPKDDDQLPDVQVGIFIEQPTPFLEEFFVDFLDLDYPIKKIHLIIHNAIPYHNELVERFINEEANKYGSYELISSDEPEWKAREICLVKCKQRQQEQKCDYYLVLDSVARIELPDTLRILIEANKTIIAPLLNRPTKLWSNFWGSMTNDGFYARSHDYVELVRRDRLGIWIVAHIMNAYLINGRFISDNLSLSDIKQQQGANKTPLSYRLIKDNHHHHHHHDRGRAAITKASLIFSHNLRESNILQYMINTHEFGHLIDPSSYNTSLVNPDFYQLTDNVLNWERAYLHDNFSKVLEDEFKLEQPCQDVSWFPLVNERFSSQLIEIMESFGQWSGGTNQDPRIEGGYESVPTRDIHMKQVGLHEMWLKFLREYVMPVQMKEYIGYEHDPPRANLAFVVRYHPQEQAFLQPHHDSSTYTLNIALNRPGFDYEGGGCRFARYNCSVTESRLGWALIHPGRLTHYHEGLPVTKGVRYIMVTFVDP